MVPEHLQRLLQTEDDRVEWKLAPTGETVLEAVCALANDLGDSRRPGYVVLGVDKRGAPVGLDPSRGSADEQQQRVVNQLRSVKLLPTPSFQVTPVEAGGKRLLVIEVAPYPVPPIVQLDGSTWVRIGSTTQRAREADLQRLRERRPERNLHFDLRPWRGASLSDLERETLAAAHAAARTSDRDPESFPSLENWLTGLQLGRTIDGVWTPNPAAILLFGLSPQSMFPGATIEFVRYAGIEHDSPVRSRRTVTGTLTNQLDVVWAQLDANLATVQVGNEGIRSVYAPEYPPEALKELARNLVQHRLYEGTNAPGRIEWFDDRIGFKNPGGPFGHASEGEFGTHADYRNPTITAGLARAGYVEQLGRGVRIVRRQLEQNGNPPLEVETDNFTQVTVRRRK
jgi:ATP-dependent DNA helicase RecG